VATFIAQGVVSDELTAAIFAQIILLAGRFLPFFFTFGLWQWGQ
jgi:hypothetical protein